VSDPVWILRLAVLAAGVSLWFVVRHDVPLRWATMASLVFVGLATAGDVTAPLALPLPLLALGGVVVGVASYLAAALLNGCRVAETLKGWLPALLSSASTPRILAHYLVVAAAEECVFRLAVQRSLLGGGATAVVAAAVAFALVHVRQGDLVIADLVDVLILGLVLGGLYELTGSMTVVIVAHLVRDLTSAGRMRRLARDGQPEAAAVTA
jgi:membrane protease YdiL (CAAX protease family)